MIIIDRNKASLIIEKNITNAIQSMLDTKAREYEYDDIKSARSQASYPFDGNETVTEKAIVNVAKELAKWELKCWAKSTEIRDDVVNGIRLLPTVEEVLSEMPLLQL